MPRPARIIPAAALALAAVILGAIALWPVVASRGVYADGADTIHQRASNAKPRTILWQPPIPVESLGTPADEYEPRLSPDGQTLYFVRGRAGHNADIYSCTRTPKGWSDPIPLAINSDKDDLGPEPLPDGSGLLFYSDREGGLGGYDLWLAKRDDDGWSEPVNLGEPVNSPFNEYSPALTPDQRTLCFASNRPRPGETAPAAPPWPATVRETFAAHDYDLYTASFSGGKPEPAQPLAALNTDANEGTPAFSPAGDFLYFSSDRAGGRGGFDLYRSRLHDGAYARAENLGEPINSAANELDPALSLSGFGLDFSSDRALASSNPATETASDYNLYHTESREVILEREPRPIDWAGLWSAVAPWLLALVLLLLLLLLLRVGRDVLQHKRLSTLTKCLLGSLLAHILILLLLSLWGVSTSIGEFFRRPGGSRVHLTSALPAADSLTHQIRGTLTTPDAPLPELTTLTTPAITIQPTIAADFPSPELAKPSVSAAPALEQTLAEASPPTPTVPAPTPPNAPAQSRDLPAPQSQPAPAVSEQRQASAAPQPVEREAALPTPVSATTSSPSAPRSDVTQQQARLALQPTEAPPPTATPRLSPHELAAAPQPNLQVPSAPAPTGSPTERTPDRPSASIETPSASPPITTPTPAPATTSAPRAPIAAQAAEPPVRLSDTTPDSSALPPLDAAEPSPETAAALPVPTDITQASPAPAEAEAQSPSPQTATAAQPTLTSPLSLPHPSPGAQIPSPAIAPSTVATSIRSHDTPIPEQSAPQLTIADAPRIPRPAIDLKLPTDRARAPSQNPQSETSISAPAPDALGLKLPSPTTIPNPTLDAPNFKSAPDIRAEAPAPALDLKLHEHEPDGSAAKSLSDVSLPLAAAPDLKLPTEREPVENPFPQRAPEVREKVLEQRGGDKDTEAAVTRALAWLARHQSKSGKWDTKDFDDACGECGGAGSVDGDIAVTGLSLLCFFGGDHTHLKDGPYRENITKGIEWLLRRQSETGDLRGDESMYTHAIATIALAEAYAMTRDPRLAEPVRKAIAFIAEARSPKGGWRYEPGQYGDTSVLGWQLMAMVSARRAGIAVPDDAITAAKDWLDEVSVRPGVYAYQPGNEPTPSMTAEGWFCRQLLGEARDSKRTEGSRAFLEEVTPKWGRRSTTYMWYYATLAYFQHGGEEWDRWNAAVKKQLVDHQETDGPAAGSWDPLDRWSTSGGRVYQTALCTLTLEVYYRYLPMYAPAPTAAPERR